MVRLKGGDPFIFGRGSEEAAELVRAGIPYEVVPGITAAQGCAAAARIPLTHRGLATGVRFVTGHRRANEPLNLDWATLADPETTLVVYMGLANIEEIVGNLITYGLSPDTPALAVCQGTTPAEQRLCTWLAALPAAAREADLPDPFCSSSVGSRRSPCNAKSTTMQRKLARSRLWLNAALALIAAMAPASAGEASPDPGQTDKSGAAGLRFMPRADVERRARHAVDCRAARTMG